MGCASGITYIKPVYPEALLQKCLDRPIAYSGELVDLIQNHIEVTTEYDKCQLRHNKLIEFIDEQ